MMHLTMPYYLPESVQPNLIQAQLCQARAEQNKHLFLKRKIRFQQCRLFACPCHSMHLGFAKALKPYSVQAFCTASIKQKQLQHGGLPLKCPIMSKIRLNDSLCIHF